MTGAVLDAWRLLESQQGAAAVCCAHGRGWQCCAVGCAALNDRCSAGCVETPELPTRCNCSLFLHTPTRDTVSHYMFSLPFPSFSSSSLLLPHSHPSSLLPSFLSPPLSSPLSLSSLPLLLPLSSFLRSSLPLLPLPLLPPLPPLLSLSSPSLLLLLLSLSSFFPLSPSFSLFLLFSLSLFLSLTPSPCAGYSPTSPGYSPTSPGASPPPCRHHHNRHHFPPARWLSL